MHTAQKCNILLSVEIHVLEIQQALISMETSVERFVEIGAPDLFVSTQWLQDSSYNKVWETYSSLSIGLEKWIIQILLFIGILDAIPTHIEFAT